MWKGIKNGKLKKSLVSEDSTEALNILLAGRDMAPNANHVNQGATWKVSQADK